MKAFFKKKSFYILGYLWEIIIKMSGDLEFFSFKSGQFWPFVPFVPLYQLKSYFSDQNSVNNSLVISFFSLVRSRLCRYQRDQGCRPFSSKAVGYPKESNHTKYWVVFRATLQYIYITIVSQKLKNWFLISQKIKELISDVWAWF
jgi:hypothetical protein